MSKSLEIFTRELNMQYLTSFFDMTKKRGSNKTNMSNALGIVLLNHIKMPRSIRRG